MTQPTHLTRRDAAELTGHSYDSVRRWERQGLLPNNRTNEDGVVEISIADLVAAGKLDPLAGARSTEIVGRSRLERDLAAARHRLALADAEITALTERIAAQAGDIDFLRTLVSGQRTN